ncbi:hypothetical protein F0L74_24725 [Chitinophaga agrisoli]|uniref:Thiopeptide-type bacteriocin biosynthesis protein n=1 Tax=Chitinophaga agrisoli TaxID=2607653 RepID=A0A5B2VLA0_9BACT|nr:lantibiotic dehydratase [Chitinophaga agrisoli]KAA2239410.1 hypothetical protein F0L74_24725 [Chitinophaga agrisoli]
MAYLPYTKVLMRTPLKSYANIQEDILLNDDLFEEGLYLSSPEFWAEFKKYREGGAKNQKLEHTALKYWIRSCMRCTPYGTFAGSMLLSTGPGTEIILRPQSAHRKFLRLDTNFLTTILQGLSRLPVIRQQLHYSLNNSLYLAGNTYRYAEYRLQHTARVYELTAAERTRFLDAVIALLQTPQTLQALQDMLERSFQAPPAAVAEYLQEIEQAQIIISALEPAITGEDPLKNCLQLLKTLNGIPDIYSFLSGLYEQLSNPAAGTSFYSTLEEKLKQLPFIASMPKTPFQADLFMNTSAAMIDQELIANLSSEIGELKAFSRMNQTRDLENFKSKFRDTYEDAEVPLNIALDADLGIGYGSVQTAGSGAHDFVGTLMLGNNDPADQQITYDTLHRFIFRKTLEAIRQQQKEIVITEADLKTIQDPATSNFPAGQFVLGSLMKIAGRLDKDNFQFHLKAFGGSSGGNLLGRFSAGDADIADLLKEILQKEETLHPDILFAEIVHLPQARIGNILIRPVLRKYEIPYIGTSGIPAAMQIPINDLMVSVQRNEVVLRSIHHNKRVMPCLTTAHNYSNGALPMYKFLCDLQLQGKTSYSWDWGVFAGEQYLPRVVFKHIVIKPASWKVTVQDISDLSEDHRDICHYFENWRNKYDMPQQVIIKESDNDLLVNFSFPASAQLFAAYLRKKKELRLEEFLFSPDEAVVHDEAGQPYCNELIIPLLDTTHSRPLFPATVRTLPEPVKRQFAPGDNWLYLKIYTGNKQAEKILTQQLLPFVKEGRSQGLFEHCFFVRYFDTAAHLRIRFYNSDPAMNGTLHTALANLLQPLIAGGTIRKIQFDTYQRELERYGNNTMSESEQLFGADSLAVLEFLELLQGNDEKYRWLFAMRGIDALLEDFDLSLPERNELMEQIRKGFFQEFGGHAFLLKQLNNQYRDNQQFITAHMNKHKDTDNEIEEIANLLAARSESNAAIIRQIVEKKEKEEILSLLPSYIHMFMNRLFIAQQRKCELVVYHFLEKFYRSAIALNKKDKLKLQQ